MVLNRMECERSGNEMLVKLADLAPEMSWKVSKGRKIPTQQQ